MNQIVALVGFKNSGKSTAALPLIERGFQAFSFADSIKDSLASIFCWDRHMIEGATLESRKWREQIDKWWAEKLDIPEFSPRWAMMNFGTQLMRECFNINIWLYNMERRIMQIGDQPVVIVDCRFTNEIVMVHNHNALVIRIKRDDDPSWMETARAANAGNTEARAVLNSLSVHESEFGWVGSPVDATIINDRSVADLQSAVVEAMETHRAGMDRRPLQ